VPFAALQHAFRLVGTACAWCRSDAGCEATRGFIAQRFFSFTMVLGVAFLLLVSLLLSTALSAVGSVVSASLLVGAALWQMVSFVVSLGRWRLPTARLAHLLSW
jgi:membrane protein